MARGPAAAETAAQSDADALPAATVTVYPDGPLVVRGDFAIRGVEDALDLESGSAVALCRCGRSAVKPLCDGSHKTASTTRRRTAARRPRQGSPAAGQDTTATGAPPVPGSTSGS